MNLNEVVRIVREEWNQWYRADLSCQSCCMTLIEDAFKWMDEETGKQYEDVFGHKIGEAVYDERGTLTQISEIIFDEWNPTLGDIYIALCDTGYYASFKKPVDNIRIDFENNFPNNINT